MHEIFPCHLCFLEEISSLSHSIVFLYFFALITEKGFLISPCYPLELCIQMDMSFLFFLCLSLPSSQLFVSPPQTTILHFCITFSWEWSWLLPPVQCYKPDLNQIPYDYTVEVRNKFKGLDLINQVPEELWTEVCDIVQETGIKTIPIEKKCKKAKWLPGEALQIAVKRREAKGKGEKERHTHLNAEFQRIARRDKKAFLSDQCKEIEENNTMGKTRDLFKKSRDTKGMFNAKMGTIKDRNGMDLTEAERF